MFAPTCRGSSSGGEIGKIETAETHVRTLAVALPRSLTGGHTVLRIEPELIVHLPFLGIIQDVIGFLYVLETILGRLIPRIQIRMIFTGKLPVCLPNLIFGSFPLHAECLVVI